jgi:purine-binding chemotaxis protein CheW
VEPEPEPEPDPEPEPEPEPETEPEPEPEPQLRLVAARPKKWIVLFYVSPPPTFPVIESGLE